MRRGLAWRTARNGNTHVTVWDMVICAAVAFALPLALGFSLGRVPGLEILTIFALSSFFAPLPLLLGLFFGLSALKRGRAGWLVAILAGGLTSYLILLFVVLLDDGPTALTDTGAHYAAMLLSPVGMTYASLMWVTLYLRRPKAFFDT